MASLLFLVNKRKCFSSVHRLSEKFMLVIILGMCIIFVQSDAFGLSESCKGSTNHTGLKGSNSIKTYP